MKKFTFLVTWPKNIFLNLKCGHENFLDPNSWNRLLKKNSLKQVSTLRAR